MHKGRLLASICSVGLLAAAPAFAAETPDTGTNAPATDTGTNHPATHHGMHHAMHHGTHHMAKAGSGKSDTSQNAAVEDLNQQSLQAAREGHDLSMGGGGMGGGGAGAAPGAPAAPPGAMGGPGGAPPAPAPAAGGGKM